ncbi:MAG: glutamine synthetase III [Gemmatimonadota bacterium]
MPSATTPRFDALAAAKTWQPADPNGREKERPALEDFFGEHTFGVPEMKARLPKEIFERLQKTLETGSKLDPGIADAVAVAMKEWALEQGATHFTHWFQPLTGATAEKHDSFVALGETGRAVTEFSGSELIQGEPDASSLPSGGLRTTFEARGYTAWDPTSPAFLIEGPGGATLCIPTAYSSWAGDALDQKIPLLRSLDALEEQTREALKLFGVETSRVTATLGPEQEFFLVDQEFYYRRPDLLTTGRTLFGARPPKGQELEDHYFGAIPDRVLEYMQAVETQLYRLGIPVKTRHNEVAPGQFEMAFIYEDANTAADHQQLMMSTLRRVARRFGLVCLLHEKPFAGVNGSGKHLNWALATDRANLLEPGDTPHENMQFLFFCTAALMAVEKHQDLLRASVAFAGNDHRLGANEAPPAIVSVFLGDQLTDVYEQIVEAGRASSSKQGGLLGLGVKVLPEIPKHAGDRNRTSPFAFTGNKFEFRALGASQSVSFSATVLNTVMAEAIETLRKQLASRIRDHGEDLPVALQGVLAEVVPEIRHIIFNGDGYSEGWFDEAERRGLLNLPTTLDALPYMVKDKNAELFEKYGVLSRRELESRYEIALGQYFHTINIEGETTADMAATMILPAAVRYLNELLEGAAHAKDAGIRSRGIANRARAVAELVDELEETLEELVAQNAELGGDEVPSKAVHMRKKIIPAMDRVREVADRLERILPDDVRPMPPYRDMLFIK